MQANVHEGDVHTVTVTDRELNAINFACNEVLKNSIVTSDEVMLFMTLRGLITDTTRVLTGRDVALDA